MKPSGLHVIRIKPTLINSFIIEQIELDLAHVNYGLDSQKYYREKARTGFTAEEIVTFFESLSGLRYQADSNENWDYYTVSKAFLGDHKLFKMVFCINRNEPRVAGIITFFRIKR